MTSRIILPHHLPRIKECQALFRECLTRYKQQGQHTTPPWNEQQIIAISLRTLAQNGFSQVEIERAMQHPVML